MKKLLTGIIFLVLSMGAFAYTENQKEILRLVNVERAERGLKPMKLNSTLNKLARIKSNDMYQNEYFSHNSPKYGSPFDLMKKYGVKYRTAGENIAKGQDTPQYVMRMWMESKGHRKNILNPKFEEMGLSKDQYGENIWTQMFIGNY